MEILELKNIVTKILEKLMNWLNSRMVGKDKGISELDDRTIETAQCGKRREKRLEKKLAQPQRSVELKQKIEYLCYQSPCCVVLMER